MNEINEIMLSGIHLAEQISDETPLKRWKNNAGQLEFYDGWHKYNPNNIKCEDCTSIDIEWLWDNGEVVGFHCNTCGETSLSK